MDVLLEEVVVVGAQVPVSNGRGVLLSVGGNRIMVVENETLESVPV